MAERPPDHHVGVAPDDPRNRAPIAYFKPKPVTADSARASLRQALPHATDGDVEARVERLLQKIATGPLTGSSAVLGSQPLVHTCFFARSDW
jgi:hypothetical protein